MYTEQEKLEIEHVLDVFADFVKDHPLVDVAYSEKFGYMLVHGQNGQLDEEWIPLAVTSGRHLFDLLSDELYADYLEAREGGFEVELSEAEQDEILNQIDYYAKQLPEYDINVQELFVEA